MKNFYLKKQLRVLKKIQPTSEWKSENRNLLLSQIRAQVAPEYSRIELAKQRLTFSWNVVRLLSPQLVWRPLGSLVLALFLIIGSSVASVSANNSLPGDLLYSVKMVAEKAQLGLTSAPEDRARLEVEFAGRRIDELQQLVFNGKSDSSETAKKQIALTTERAKKSLENAKSNLASFTAGVENEEEQFHVARVIGDRTDNYQQVLQNTINAIPEDIQTEVRNQVEDTLDKVEEMGVTALHTLIKQKGTAEEQLGNTEALIKKLDARNVSIRAKIAKIRLSFVDDSFGDISKDANEIKEDKSIETSEENLSENIQADSKEIVDETVSQKTAKEPIFEVELTLDEIDDLLREYEKAIMEKQILKAVEYITKATELIAKAEVKFENL